jgi:hypothetical protein
MKAAFVLLTIISCQSFGQLKPNLAFQGKIIPFDEKFTVEANPVLRGAILEGTTDAVDSLLSQGVVDIGNVNLLNFKEQIKQVNLLVVTGGATALGSGQFTVRMGNVYVPSTKTIYINEQTLVMNREGSAKLMPHEFLGALGYEDERYQISTIMLSRNAKLSAELINKNKIDLGKKSIRSEVKNMVNQKGSGGVTIIGGGGDDLLFVAKLYMLDHYQEWQSWFRDKYLNESDYYGLALRKGIDLRVNLNDEVFNDYLTYFTGVGIEHMADHLRKTNEPLKNPVDIEQILNVYDENGEAFIRLSREHWNYPLGPYTVEQSRMMMSMTLHTALFESYILKRFRK